MQLSEIVEVQKNGWLIVQGHIPAVIAFMIYMIAGTAETNRAPFDMAEAESELGAGFHTEYSGMKFAYFFLAEFINMFLIAVNRNNRIFWSLAIAFWNHRVHPLAGRYLVFTEGIRFGVPYDVV